MKAKHANEILAENIKRLMRGHSSLNTQVKLAKRAGIAQSSINRVLAASVHPQLDVIEAIADALHVTPADLLSTGSASEDLGFDRAKFLALPQPEREKAASYIRFLVTEHEQRAGTNSVEKDFISLSILRDLPEEQLAQVMRSALRELNNSTHTDNESAKPETKARKRGESSRN